MRPRILVMETNAGDSVVSAYQFLKNINCNLYIASLFNQEDTKKYCKYNNHVYIETANIEKIPENCTLPRLGIYTSFAEQENTYLAYYQKEKLDILNIVKYVIDKVNPTHILTNAGLISMYNIYLRSCIAHSFNNVIYYVEKPYYLMNNYTAVNEIVLKPKIKKISLTPKEIANKLKIYKQFFNKKLLTLYPDIMTCTEEFFKG